MGVGFFFGALGALIGAPINGELLGDTDIWWKTLIFSGVRLTFILPFFISNIPMPAWILNCGIRICLSEILLYILIHRFALPEDKSQLSSPEEWLHKNVAAGLSK
jgi:hypothetical protein